MADNAEDMAEKLDMQAAMADEIDEMFRPVFRLLDRREQVAIVTIKSSATDILDTIRDGELTNTDPRLRALAITYLEIAVMLAVKAISAPVKT